MHPRPRRTLRRLLKQYGQDLLNNPECVDALLADHCGKYRAERFVLVCALRERVSAANWSPDYWLNSCSQRLQSRYCFSAEAAQWATESWSSALGIAAPDPKTLSDIGDSNIGRHAEFSESPRRTLSKLLTDYGFDLLNEPARVDALLADLCGEFDRERFLLFHALREGISADLLSQKRRISTSRLQLTQRLEKRYCFSDKAAQWAVESWSTALHHSSPATAQELPEDRKSERKNVVGRLSLRHIVWLGLFLIGVMVLAFAWQSVVEYAEWRGAWLQSIPELVGEKLAQFGVRVAKPAIAWLLGFPGLIALGAISGLLAFISLGPKRVWGGIARLFGVLWMALKRVSGRLSLLQKMWLVSSLIGIIVLGYTWQSAIGYAEWGVAWLQGVPGLVGEKLSQFVDLVAQPAIAWLLGFPGLIALGAISGLLATISLGPKRVWGGIARLFRILWIALKWVSGRLSLRQKMWLVSGLIGIMVLGYTWQSAIGYAEWGVIWIQGVPGQIKEKLSQFFEHVAIPVTTWLVGPQGLIALGAIVGLSTVKLLGLRKVWKGFTWLTRMTWLGLGKVWRGFAWLTRMTWLGLGQVWKGFAWLVGMTWLGLGQVWKGFAWLVGMTWLGLGQVWKGFAWLVGVTWLGLGQVWKGFTWLVGVTWLGLGQVLERLSLRLKMWLGLGLMGIMVLALTWQTTTVYTEMGITWLLSIPTWTEAKVSQFVGDVAQPIKTWLVGTPGLIALGTIAGLLAVKLLGLERVWRGISWLTRVTWLGLGIAFGQLVLRGNMWLGLGFIGILVLALVWQNSVVNTEWGITWLPGIPEWIEEKFSQFVDHVAQPVITWLAGNRDQ